MTSPISTLTAPAAAMMEDGIDTDLIFPARFLLRMDKKGLGECLFADRRAEASTPFVLDRPDGRPVQILLAGAQFGCGSSREHAVWSLVDFGIRAVIAPSFGEIFANNAARNGLAAIPMERALIDALVQASETQELTVDLTTKTVSAATGPAHGFAMSETDRLALINGWDEIDLIHAAHHQDIDRFEAAYRARRPWMFDAPQPHTA